MQEAFSHLLGEQNELTQELASQGMSIVYDLGDESMKQSLVNALVNTLTGSGKRKRAIKVIFEYIFKLLVFGMRRFFFLFL
jgi:proteasome component ECM29